MVVYLAVSVLAIILRVIAHLHYSSAIMAVHMDTRKELTSKADLAKLKNPALRKIVAEYIRAVEHTKTASSRPIIERTVAKKSLLGWRYHNVMPLVESLETGLLLVGLILAVTFSDNAFAYGTLTAAVFVITRLNMAFFNARAAQAQLVDDIQIYIERDVSRFFVPASPAAAGFDKKALEDLGHIISTAMKQVSVEFKEATAAIAPAIEGRLAVPLEQWKSIAQEMADVSKSVADSSENLNTATENMVAHAQNITKASEKLTSSCELLGTHMHAHSGALSNQLTALTDAIAQFATQQEALTNQAKYIERNQQTLDATITSYEESLQNLTQSLGDGLGAFVNIHAQTSAQTINDAFKANLDKLFYAREGSMTYRPNGGDEK